MRGGSFLVAVFAAAGCAGTTPAATDPAESSSAEEATAATAGPGNIAPGTAPHDDPASCVDPQEAPTAAEEEAHQRIDAKLGKLAACTAGLKEPGLADLVFAPSAGGLTHVAVSKTNVEDCRVIACLKRGLDGLALPPPDPERPLYGRVVALEPRAIPRNEPHADLTRLETAKGCGDPHPPSAFGILTPQQIQSVVRSHYREFGDCHQAALLRDPKLRGLVAIGFVIDREGHVKNARVAENTFWNCAVPSCVRNKFAALEFPKPAGGVVTVVYPFTMEPGHRRGYGTPKPGAEPPR